MTTAPRGRSRRKDALSKTRIIAAAIAILDAQGEAALTIRAIASHFKTGSGAIFHHVGSKEELVRAAAHHFIAEVTGRVPQCAAAADEIRSVMLNFFDAVDAHPWVGAQLSREPWHLALLDLFADLGDRLRRLDVPEGDVFNTASTLVNYLLGSACQCAAAARQSHDVIRAPFLAAAVQHWVAARDPVARPFADQIVTQLADHDDRTQFVAGVELIIAGITATYH